MNLGLVAVLQLLPALPVIARVHVDVTHTRVLVVHEIVMGRGEWARGDLDLWASFGPVLPQAIDAQLLSVAPGASAPSPTDNGEALALDKTTRRPASARPLLGRSRMAGVVLHLREAAFRRATAASQVLAIRLRQVLPVPSSDAQGRRELVVRLGVENGSPLALRRLDLSSSEPGFVLSPSAQLCGPQADPYILGFASVPAGATQTWGAIDPLTATRRSTDDLCILF